MQRTRARVAEAAAAPRRAMAIRHGTEWPLVVTLLTALTISALLAACAPADTANVEARLHLTVNPQGTGTVTITSELGTTECSESCVVTFPKGTTVSLEPAPADVAPFVGWTGDCDGEAPCDLRLDADRSVTATFAEYVLVVRIVGDGAVRADVTPGPGGAGTLTCTSDCIVPYDGPLTASIAVTPTESNTTIGAWTGCSTLTGDAYCLAGVTGRSEVSFVATRPPTAVDDAYTFLEDQDGMVAAAEGVLANDVDTQGDTLRVHAVTVEPQNGTLAMEPDGGFTYVPDLHVNVDTDGVDRFTYVTTDAFGNTSEPATVEITVVAVNDPPTFEIAADPPPTKDGSGAQVVPAFATGIGPGGGVDEASQALTFAVEPVSTTGTIAFREPPALALDGTLRYAHQLRTYGSATFTAVLVDDGGTELGGSDRRTQDFTIVIEPLFVTVIVEGPGTVTLDPEGGAYPYDTWVVVRAVPDEDAELDDWGGACGYLKTKNDTCWLYVDEDVTVSVRFEDD